MKKIIYTATYIVQSSLSALCTIQVTHPMNERITTTLHYHILFSSFWCPAHPKANG